MATTACVKRLQKEYSDLQKNPLPDIEAAPDPGNLLAWYFVFEGPKDTPYEGGEYFGRIQFPTTYPFKPPSVYMLTPSGRFKTDTSICMSMTSFHPESWSPMWNAGKIIQGLASFMVDVEASTGTIETDTKTKVGLARSSRTFNLTMPKYQQVFPQRHARNTMAAAGPGSATAPVAAAAATPATVVPAAAPAAVAAAAPASKAQLQQQQQQLQELQKQQLLAAAVTAPAPAAPAAAAPPDAVAK
jgi:ubiquitin-conjugating enzyme E2 J2